MGRISKTTAVAYFKISILSPNSLEGKRKSTELLNNVTEFHAVKVEQDLSTTELEVKKHRRQFRYRLLFTVQ
jgi:hypothetical protein